MTNLTDKVDLFNNTQKGGLIGAIGTATGLSGYNELTMTPEERINRDAMHKKWRNTSVLNRAKDIQPALGSLFPSDEYKKFKTSAKQPLRDKGIDPVLATAVGALSGAGIAGGLTAKQMGMFSYMTAKYSDSKKPKNWGKLGKYDRSKLGK
jgi:hypothetical protein